MLKSIFTQLTNCKKNNGWIALELLLVFCVLWYLADYFFVIACNHSLPSYMDTYHTYQVNITQFSPGHPAYSAEENEPGQIEDNYSRLLNHIRAYPGVTHLAVSFGKSAPGSDSFSYTTLGNPKDSTRAASIRILTIDPESDYFGVFGFSEGYGQKRVSTQDYEWEKPNAIIINSLAASQLFPDGNIAGKIIEETYNKDKQYEIAGIIDYTKRLASERPEALCFFQRHPDASSIPDAEISIRIDPSMSEASFLPAFTEKMENSLRIGNFYFLSAASYNSNMKQLNELYGYNADRRIRLYLMIFFLVNVILCVMGTFWYRVNVRREEIGLRMALGSSRKGIKRLLIAEGLLLLTLITLPALLIEWQFVQAGLIETYGKGYSQVIYLPDRIFLRFMITNLLTWLLMAIFITIAIWLPARLASLFAPAEALHYE